MFYLLPDLALGILMLIGCGLDMKFCICGVIYCAYVTWPLARNLPLMTVLPA